MSYPAAICPGTDPAFDDDSADKHGRVTYNRSEATLNNCKFARNAAYSGGGMHIYCGGATLTGCTFINNRALEVGGGLYDSEFGGATLSSCVLACNIAYRGGGLQSSHPTASWTLTGCILTDNKAHAGGALYGYGGAEAINCIFTGNAADLEGGAIYNSGSSPILVNSLVNGNSAWAGGGMFNLSGSDATVINSTFSENVATLENGGGAMHNYDSSPTLTNCILWADDPNEIADAGGSSTTVTYSDIEGGWPGQGNINADPLFVGGQSGVWTSEPSYAIGACQTTLTDGTATWEVDELVGKFVNPDVTQRRQFLIVANSETAMTVWGDASAVAEMGDSYQVFNYHLSAGSPCIDAADNMGVPPDVADLDEDGNTAEQTPLDLDLNPRFVDDPDTETTGVGSPAHPDPEIVDMGAYEYQKWEACCLPDGTCVMLLPNQCVTPPYNGQPMGSGTVCEPTGACCLPTRLCIMTTEECCNVTGVTYHGDWSCHEPQACCSADDNCTIAEAICCDETGDEVTCPSQCLGDYNGNGIDEACEEPPNDDCENATEITTLPYSESLWYCLATSDLDVSCNWGGAAVSAHGVWWRYEPPEDCDAMILVTGDHTATAIFTGGDCDDLTEVYCSDSELVAYAMEGGVTYWVMVSKWLSNNVAVWPPEPLSINFYFGHRPIPTVSEWGMVAMTLLVVTAGTIVFVRRPPAVA